MEFLDWAQRFFDISICSLGEKSYVDMVVQVLDPSKSLIKGLVYSARDEYQYLVSQMTSDVEEKMWLTLNPPKDIKTLFAFCEKGDTMTLEPLIVDDNVFMWNQSQRDQVIVNLFSNIFYFKK
jgi:hypothetical protein